LGGLAVSSYYSYPLERDGKPVLHEGKQLHMGVGIFVYIYHPQVGFYTGYCHLERVAPAIKFHNPVRRGSKLWPVGHKILPDKLSSYRWTTEVQTGQLIGYVGDTGIGWGYEDFPIRPDPKKYPTFDEIHLHFEVFTRVGARKTKRYFDPYGIKSQANDYPDSYKAGSSLGGKGKVLWILDNNGKPKHIKIK